MIAVRSMIACAAVLSAAATAAQQSVTPQPAFEVASVRLDGPEVQGTSFSARGDYTFTARGARLLSLIASAYGVGGAQVEGLPKWDATTRYSITAKPAGDKPLTDEQLQSALQQLLSQRLHLIVHRTVKQVSGYALVVAKDKPKLEPGKGGYSYSDGIQADKDGFEVYNITMARFCSVGLPFFVGIPSWTRPASTAISTSSCNSTSTTIQTPRCHRSTPHWKSSSASS